MSVKNFVKKQVERLFAGTIEAKVQERLPAAVDSFSQELGWRKLTGNDTRQLPMMTQDRQIEVAYWLWKTNPLANWIIEVTVAFVCGKGMPYDCKDEDVKAVLDDFWKTNRLKIYWVKWVREMGIYGELCLPAYVAEQTGKVRLGYVDPAHIDHTITDPENVMVKIGIKLKDGGRGGRTLRTILDPGTEEFLSDQAKALRDTYTDGQCFYFSLNDLTNEPRGTSDLFTVADHVDNYEQFLYDSAEKYGQFNAFYWDIEVTGADGAELEKNRAAYTPPKTGGAFLHNEKVKSTPIAPDMKAVDAEKGARLHRNHILGARGLPEHWFGGGGDVNRATAAEMDTPSMTMIENRQELVLSALEQILDFALYSAIEAGFLKVAQDAAVYALQKPEMNKPDITKFSAGLQQIAASLTIAATNGWIDDTTAKAAFAFAMTFIGYEYNPEEMDDTPPEGRDYRTKPGPVIDPAVPGTAVSA